jgi:hypothetical protein
MPVTFTKYYGEETVSRTPFLFGVKTKMLQTKLHLQDCPFELNDSTKLCGIISQMVTDLKLFSKDG